MLRGIFVAGLFVSLTVSASAARAQGATAGVDLPKVTQDVRDGQEDLILLRAIAALKLTNTQLKQLLPVLQATQDKMKAQDTQDATALKKSQADLEVALKQALAGQQIPSKGEDNYRELLTTIQTRRDKLRTDLVTTIRSALKRILTQDQQAAMAAVGQDMFFFERQMDMQARAASGQGQGPLGALTGTLDRVRDVPPAEWEQTKNQYAQRFGGGGFGGRPGGGGPGGGGPGGGNAQPNPQRDAAQQARMTQFLQIAEQARSMPADQYSQQKFTLAGQLMRNMARGFGQNPDPEQSISAFIQRYLLSNRIVPVVREKTGG